MNKHFDDPDRDPDPLGAGKTPEPRSHDLKSTMAFLMAVTATAPLIAAPLMTKIEFLTPDWWRLFIVTALAAFIPILAFSFFFYRKDRRAIEIRRIAQKLNAAEDDYIRMFENIHSGPYFLIATALAWLISLTGLVLLVFGSGIFGGLETSGFPKQGSLLVFGMAHLGAYLWGLQYVFRRYVLNDLIPGAFFRLSIRMIVASVLAVILFNAYESMASTGTANGTANGNLEVWPAIAFLLGAFPQRALNWMLERNPLVAEPVDPSVRPLPLRMIEGLNSYDQMRLEELGIDDCYGLANYDLVPLVLKTSYSARTLADWVLQAKLCVHCGPAVASLRLLGIRGVHDLAQIKEQDLEALAKETEATLMSLLRARSAAAKSDDVEMLQHVSGLLGRYTDVKLQDRREPVPTPS